MEIISLLGAAFYGLLIGSFLNVCIYRMPRKLSILSPYRSYCPNCEKQLLWWHNIPVFSWLILKAKCHFCEQQISGQYPLVEMLSALAALASVIEFGFTPNALIAYILSASLIVITFTDLEFMIIPNLVSYPGMIFGLLLGILAQYTSWFSFPITQGAFDSLVGFLLGGGIFYTIGQGYYLWTGREGLGGGDIKLLAMTGAILGGLSVPTTILIGSLLGGVYGIVAIIFRGGGRHSELPFGPWLALAALLYLFTDLGQKVSKHFAIGFYDKYQLLWF